MAPSLNVLVLIGYTILWVAGILQLPSVKHPLDLLANLALLTGLGALIWYHATKERIKLTEKTDKRQRQKRLTAHVAISIFFMLTFLSLTRSIFQWYDMFGLMAHMHLIYAVQSNASQLIGIMLLLLYFLFVCIYSMIVKAPLTAFQWFQLSGRLILLAYFAIATNTSLTQ